MASNDAWALAGMNGAALVGPGQTFTGLSRGYQVVDTAVLDYSIITPAGAIEPVYVAGTQAIGVRINAPISVITVGTGQVLAYPESTSYTIA